MKRRDFLKGVSALFMAPAIVQAENIMKVVPIYSDNEFIINPITKEIEYVGNKSGISVLEFHRWLHKEFDKPNLLIEPIPTLRHTDNNIELINEWTTNDGTIQLLRDGVLRMEDTSYINIRIRQ